MNVRLCDPRSRNSSGAGYCPRVVSLNNEEQAGQMLTMKILIGPFVHVLLVCGM